MSRPLKREPIFSGKTVRIPLTKGLWAIVDRVDADLAFFNWTAELGPKTAYAYRRGPKPRQEVIRLHRLIATRKRINERVEVDHRDGNGLNDRRRNLRSASSSQQKCNTSLRSDNTSGVRGVSWSRTNERWIATITFDGRQRTIGRFASKPKAIRARLKEERALHGEFRRIA